jgi:hypothetical protein
MSLLNKSIASMLSAIEIYNKPCFAYREESFAILAVNAWELLLKAHILQINHYNKNSIYELDISSRTKKPKPRLNRCGNPLSISISKAIDKLNQLKKLPKNLEENINSLIELRDNVVHFVVPNITKQIQELGFACIKNYITIIKKWELEIDLSKYNFYLMPLAYVDAKIEAESILTSETKLYLDFIQSKIKNQDNTDEDFDIAISIDIKFKKGNSFDSIGMKYDQNGVPIILSEENIRERFSLTYSDVTTKGKERYSDFIQNSIFHKTMSEIKTDNKIHHTRILDPDNKKSQKKDFYSTNIWKELDKHYTVKQKKKKDTQPNLFDDN